MVLGICLLGSAAFGEETVASFAKQSLGLDLTSIPFGSPLPANAGNEKVAQPNSPPPLSAGENMSWITNAACQKYEHEFPHRILRYGFHEGRLMAIRISMNPLISADRNGRDRDQVHNDIVRIWDEYVKANASHHLEDDASFRIHVGLMCSPATLDLMELEITPVESKKIP